MYTAILVGTEMKHNFKFVNFIAIQRLRNVNIFLIIIMTRKCKFYTINPFDIYKQYFVVVYAFNIIQNQKCKKSLIA